MCFPVSRELQLVDEKKDVVKKNTKKEGGVERLCCFLCFGVGTCSVPFVCGQLEIKKCVSLDAKQSLGSRKKRKESEKDGTKKERKERRQRKTTQMSPFRVPSS